MSLLTSDERWSHLKNRGFERAVGRLIPQSAAERTLSLAPDAGPERICGILKDHVLVWTGVNSRWVELIFRAEGELLRVTLGEGGGAVFDLLSSGPDAPGRLAQLLRRFEPLHFVQREDDGVWVEFAHQGRNGLVQNSQFLRCPGWPEIRENYSPPVKAGVERLIGMPRPWDQGRLVIWHGPPGTGKTFALRALMMMWRQRFDFLVVTDPENLAANPAYYYQVASDSEEVPGRYRIRFADRVASRERRRRLLILEDSADLILQESRSSHYDKIGKLLNMTDGLCGQGRQDLFLLTFNEAVDRIDPAFLRPGRCVSCVEFTRFEREDAQAWLESRAVPDPAVERPQTLAELYARTLGGLETAGSLEAGPARVGFASR